MFDVATDVRDRFAVRPKPALLAGLEILGARNSSIAGALGVREAVVSRWRHGFKSLPEHVRPALVCLLRQATAQARRDLGQLRSVKTDNATREHFIALRERLRLAEGILHREGS